MIWLRKRLVAWLMPEIDRALREQIAKDVAAGALAGGRAMIFGTRRPDLFITTRQALPSRPPRSEAA